MLGHGADFWERIRAVILPRLGIAVQYIEDIAGNKYYVRSETHNNEFVGRVPFPEENFERKLDTMDFQRNPLSSWKRLESDPDQYEEASFRKIGFDEYPDMQIHVVLYDGSNIQDADSGYTYIYAHWEYRWDKHPIKHYYGKEKSGPEGVKKMKDILDQRGIPYEPIRP
jgi:hypothetical protein